MSPSKPTKGRGGSRTQAARTGESIELFRARASAVDPTRLDLVAETVSLETSARPRAKITYGEPRQEGTLPVQGVVDRSVPLSLPTFKIELFDPSTGKLQETLVFPIFPPGRFGTDVNDPAHFSRDVDPRTAICAVLSPLAAVRCLAGGGAW